MKKISRADSFSMGFDRGNYGNAYESQDWDAWVVVASENIAPEMDAQAYSEGMLVGFFSSYEPEEIGDETLAEVVTGLRTKWERD